MHVGFFLSKASVPVKTMILFAEWALCTKLADGTKSPLLDGKLLGHPKQREVTLCWWKSLCFGGCCILLASSMADFVPCDGIMEKAHLGAPITKSADKLPCQLLTIIYMMSVDIH